MKSHRRSVRSPRKRNYKKAQTIVGGGEKKLDEIKWKPETGKKLAEKARKEERYLHRRSRGNNSMREEKQKVNRKPRDGTRRRKRERSSIGVKQKRRFGHGNGRGPGKAIKKEGVLPEKKKKMNIGKFCGKDDLGGGEGEKKSM